MAISIREALQLPVMSQTKLVAGFDGLDNMIEWVTIVEVLEDINRLQDGEFLITTGFGLMESEEKQRQFQRLISMKKLSGVAIYTGFYLQEIPPAFIEAANDHHLPLIQIPTSLNFSMITKAILEQIVNNQMRLLRYSLNIHRQLTALALSNKGLNGITETLSNLINGSIVVYTSFGHITHHAIRHDTIRWSDEHTLIIDDEQVPLSFQPERHSEAFREYVLQSHKVHTRRIGTEETTFGYVVAVKEESQWEDMDTVAIEHAATVYAIEYLKAQAVEETHMRLQGEFLDDIMRPDRENRHSVVQRAKNFGLDLTKGKAVLNVQIQSPHTGETHIVKRLYDVIHHVLSYNGTHFIVRNKHNGYLVLLEVNRQPDRTAKQKTVHLSREILDYWNRFFPRNPIVIGIGRTYDHIDRIAESAKEADYAVTLRELLPNPAPVTHYDELGMYHLLLTLREKGVELRDLYEDPLSSFLNGDKRNRELLITLETYLHHNQNMQQTANHLYIHRHTLKYRLIQIEKKTGLCLDSPDDRMKLHLAVLAHKLVQLMEKKLL